MVIVLKNSVLIRTSLINDSSMLTANQVSMTSIFLTPFDVNYSDIFKNCMTTCCWTLYIVPLYLRLLRMNNNILKVYKRHSPKNIKKNIQIFRGAYHLLVSFADPIDITLFLTLSNSIFSIFFFKFLKWLFSLYTTFLRTNGTA